MLLIFDCSDTKIHSSVQDLMNGVSSGSLKDFKFDEEVCKEAFNHFDSGKRGNLGAKDLLRLADEKVFHLFFCFQTVNSWVGAETLGYIFSRQTQTCTGGEKGGKNFKNFVESI